MADSAILTGLTFHPDRSDQSAQNANWTSPLHRSSRDDRNAYVERPVRSPNERVMTLTRFSAALTGLTGGARRPDRCSQPNPS
jgi:hypothetical protein